MLHYYYCPNCGNDELLDITSDVTYLTCTNPECRFCHITAPPNSIGDRCVEYTTILSLDKWKDVMIKVEKNKEPEQETIKTTKELIKEIRDKLKRFGK